jgi:hypothetical protein
MMVTEHASFFNASTSLFGTGSVTFFDGFANMFTGTTTGSFITVFTQNSWLATSGLNRAGAYFSVRTRWRTGVDGNSEYYALAGDIGEGFGFHAVGTTLKGYASDASVSGEVDLSTTLTVGTTATDFYDLLAIRRASKVEFYVNGVLKASLTTNLPANAADSAYTFKVTNGAGTMNSNFQVTYVTVGLPMK